MGLLGPAVVAGIITALELIETSEGYVVEDAARFVDHHRHEGLTNKDRKYEELLGDIENLKKGASEKTQNKFFNKVLNLEERLTNVELFEANAELRR